MEIEVTKVNVIIAFEVTQLYIKDVRLQKKTNRAQIRRNNIKRAFIGNKNGKLYMGTNF